MKKLKIAVIGSGSTYTPELVNGFLTRADALPLDSLYMMDIDTEKNRIVSSLAQRMLHAAGSEAKLHVTENLEEAIEGADYVLGQVRVGRLPARILDEKIPLKYGMLGQETTGIGGFLKGMRTIPVLMNVARTMERLAPEAWLINFSNPSGMVAQALLNHTRVKTIGLCNNPINMRKFALSLMSSRAKTFDMDYVGLNHLSWITAVYENGRNILPRKLDVSRVCAYAGQHMEKELLKAVGAIPCGYLNYYYFRDLMIEKCQKAEKTRGEICVEIEKELLKLYSDESLVTKPAELDKRGGALYSEAAASLIDSLQNDKGDDHVINTLNLGAIPFMADDDVLEMRCRVDKNGPIPQMVENFNNEHIIGLMQAVKKYERLAVEAALTGNRDKALAALMTNPLTADYLKAKPALDELLEAHKAYLPQFFPQKRGLPIR